MVEFWRSPPSSSGLGRGPLKAETRVRTSLGAYFINFGLKKHPSALQPAEKNKVNLSSSIAMIEVDAHINEGEIDCAMAQSLLGL